MNSGFVKKFSFPPLLQGGVIIIVNIIDELAIQPNIITMTQGVKKLCPRKNYPTRIPFVFWLYTIQKQARRHFAIAKPVMPQKS